MDRYVVKLQEYTCKMGSPFMWPANGHTRSRQDCLCLHVNHEHMEPQCSAESFLACSPDHLNGGKVEPNSTTILYITAATFKKFGKRLHKFQ